MASTVSGESRLRSLVTINPILENTRSAGVDVAGIAKYCFANWDRHGNDDDFIFHHSSPSLFKDLRC